MAIGQKKFVINPVNSDSPDENGNNHEYIIVPTRIPSIFFWILTRATRFAWLRLLSSPVSVVIVELPIQSINSKTAGLPTYAFPNISCVKSLSNNFTPVTCAVCAPMYF